MITGESRSSGVLPGTGPIRLRIRLSAAPSQMVLERDRIPASGDYEDGERRGLLPNLHVHAIIRVEGEA
jgi:hypothetical protein